MRKAVFLDRDGTICEDVGYLSRAGDIHLYSDAGEAIRLLNHADFLVVVVTNQSGVARGNLSVETLEAIHGYLLHLVARQGGRIDAVYYCPHHPDGSCSCRKPKPGLLFKASRELQIDLPYSFLVGDKETDILAAHAAGCTGILLVRTWAGHHDEKCGAVEGHLVPRAGSLVQAATWILEAANHASTR